MRTYFDRKSIKISGRKSTKLLGQKTPQISYTSVAAVTRFKDPKATILTLKMLT
jgi:hypothetical protein